MIFDAYFILGEHKNLFNRVHFKNFQGKHFGSGAGANFFLYSNATKIDQLRNTAKIYETVGMESNIQYSNTVRRRVKLRPDCFYSDPGLHDATPPPLINCFAV
jgi:hypothetical protein